MSEIKVNSIKGVAASSAAITVNNSDGTCSVNNTLRQGRNLIKNGAMTVSQYGTVTGITSSQYAGADRFRFGLASHGTFTVSQDSTAPTDAGFSKSLKLDCTTADTSVASGTAVYFQYKLEGQDCQQIKKGTSNAEQLAVQFYVRSNKTGTYAIQLQDNDNSRSFTTTYTISSADTWEQKKFIIPADTTGTLDDDNNVSLTFNFWLVAGSTFTSGSTLTTWNASVDGNAAKGHTINIADSTSNEWFMTGFQVETGSVHTDFEHLNYQQNLALCQRYYYKLLPANGAYFGAGTWYNSNSFILHVDFPVFMRTNVTSVETTGTASHYRIITNATTVTCTSAPSALGDPNTTSLAVNFTASGAGTQGQGGLGRSGNASAFLAFSAEL